MSENIRRRKDPIGFHAEAKVTTQASEPTHQKSTFSEASGPTLETVRGSKDLKVISTWGWVGIGVALAAVGLVLLFLPLVLLGLAVVAFALFSRRTNMTEVRLRKSEQEGAGNDSR